MTDLSYRPQVWKSRRVWVISSAIVAVLLVTFGVFHFMKSPVDNVKWAYVVPPLPGAAKQPLFPDRDREKLSQVLAWIQQAKEVKDEN
jgi:hypothetical protein